MLRVACLAFPLVALALLGGCSDPVPPTPQGAFSVQFSDTGVDCSIASHRSEAGDIDASKRTTVLVDGVEGASVTCSVSGTGPFDVSAKIFFGSDGINLSIPAINVGATEMSPATGALSFFSDRTAGDAFSSSQCNFYFKEGTGQGVAAGKLWVSFACPEVVESQNKCGITESHVIIENCEQ
ncbi:hypothetical protein [Polyangium spumosum]|uniref:DUF4360 domain-containing protein n=1 Tax=Polyangium spumosum TaxID=889282 RepID=A0A6N7Q754_9BACT|nr:hypothetical protein [Polyangium spumosum]MRG98124.1 hypothetical protein [Polyangium spumosum]